MCWLLPFVQIQVLVAAVWSARIGPYTTTEQTKEPGKIRRAILGVTSEIVNRGSPDIIAEGKVTARSSARLSIERIEDCPRRWRRTARAIGHTSALGSR